MYINRILARVAENQKKKQTKLKSFKNIES